MGEEVSQDTSGLRVLKNGALADPETGRIVANPGGGKSAITPANTSEFAKLRAERYRQAAVAGMRRAASASGAGTSGAAWGYIVEKQSELATMIDKGRSSTEAARFVGSAIGVLGGPKQAEQGQNGVNQVLPGDTLRRLLDDLRLFRRQMDGE